MQKLLTFIALLFVLCGSVVSANASSTIDWKGQTWTVSSYTTARVDSNGHLVLTGHPDFSVPLHGKLGVRVKFKAASDRGDLKFKFKGPSSVSYYVQSTLSPNSYSRKITPQFAVTSSGYGGGITLSAEKESYDANKEWELLVYAENKSVEYSFAGLNGVYRHASNLNGFTLQKFVYERPSYGGVSKIVLTDFELIDPPTTTHDVTVSIQGSGTVSPNGTTKIGDGRMFLANVTPQQGNKIGSITINGTSVDVSTLTGIKNTEFGKILPIKNVKEAKNVAVTFIKIPDVTVTASSSAGGSITPNGATTVPYGGSKKFTFLPAEGYKFKSLTVNGKNISSYQIQQGKYYTLTSLKENKTVVVTFEKKTYGISVSTNYNGRLNPGGSYSTVTVGHGENQRFTLEPNTGYVVSKVIVDGEDKGPLASYTFSNVQERHTIRGEFKKADFTVTPVSPTNGSISPNRAVGVARGGNVTFSFTPEDGYRVKEVRVNDVKVADSVSSYTVENITENKRIAVVYESGAPASFAVVPSAGAGGAISPASSVNVASGGSQKFTFTPQNGYVVEKVLVNGSKVAESVPSYTVTNVTGNMTIAVSFKPAQFTITASAAAGGSISPSGAVKVNTGANQKFTFTPNAGYRVKAIIVGGITIPGEKASYTMSSVARNTTMKVLFENVQRTITASAGANGTITPSGAVKVNKGADKVFTFTPATGYVVQEVHVGGNKVADSVTSYTVPGGTTDTRIEVIFKAVQVSHTITASAGANGSISPSGATTVQDGADQTFTFTPNAGYKVQTVTVDGSPVTVAGTYAFTDVTGDHTIAVAFARKEYTVSTESGAHGTLTASAAKAAHGSSITFTLTPASNYEVATFTVNNKAVAVSGNSAVISNVTANLVARATFRATSAVTDTDGDGLDDAWEQANFGNLSQNGSGDKDNDGLSNAAEARLGTDPNDTDSDDDGMPDGWEVDNGLNRKTNDAALDADNDGYTNAQEQKAGTDPNDDKSVPAATASAPVIVPVLDLLME